MMATTHTATITVCPLLAEMQTNITMAVQVGL